MKPINVNIVLDRLLCHEEGDGSGNAEPFIWAIFFKIDADTAIFNVTGGIKGRVKADEPVLTHFSAGSHNNLDSSVFNTDSDGMDKGDIIPIPPNVGYWNTTLKSSTIKIPNMNGGDTTLEIPGIAGVFYMLLEEDGVEHMAAEAGHHALNQFFKEKINSFFTGLSFVRLSNSARAINPNPTFKEYLQVLFNEFGQFKNSIIIEGRNKVINAIKSSLVDIDFISAGLDPDDYLGDDDKVFTQTDLLINPLREFSKTLPIPMPFIGGGGIEMASDGNFTIKGYCKATPLEVPVIINDIPEDVTELIIDSTLKHISGFAKKSFIYAIGGTLNDKPFVIGRFKAIELIQNKQMRFFVKSEFGGADGKVEILVEENPTKRFPYLKTENNESKTDNLWSLPNCKMSYT
jgi:hypothetical protein